MSDRPVAPAGTPLSGDQAPSQSSDVSVAGLLNQVVLAQAADLARAGHHAAAEGLLRDRLQEAAEDSASAAVYDLLARICTQRGRFEEAEALWKQAQQIAASSEAYGPALRRAARMKRSPSWVRFLRPFLWPAFGVLLLVGLVVSVVWIASTQPAD
jgi:thioredoxin-like negative regulator of GroEL